jgi:D-serine deaminase-like pyridoxal phosphate-dependent protein
LDAVAARSGRTLGVLIDIDVGQGRTGVGDPASAVALAKAIGAAAHLQYRGVQAYYGHLQHVPAFADRLARAQEQWARLDLILTALRDAGMPAEIVSGGGTGTAALDLAHGPFTEIQPGSYLFMDRQYGAVAVDEQGGFPTALGILSHVVSANRPTCAVIDAGLKAMSTDAGPADFLDGAPPGATYKFMGDEHGGVVTETAPAVPLRLGDRVLLRAPHCDPTVNLHDAIHVVDDDRPTEVWKIDARGY